MAWPVRADPGLDRKLTFPTGFCAPSDVARPLGSTSENEFGSAPLRWSSRPRPTARNSANCTTFRCRGDPKCRAVRPNKQGRKTYRSGVPLSPSNCSKTFGRKWVPFRWGGHAAAATVSDFNGFLPHEGVGAIHRCLAGV